MPPKKATATANGDAAPGHNCNDNEIKLMLAILQNMPRPASWDLEKIAEAVGATNAKSASERIRQATNKHSWFTGAAAEDGGDGTPKTPRARKTPVSRKKKQPADDGDEDALETPTKKKPRATKAKSEAMVPKEEDEDEGEVPETAPKKEEEGDAVKAEVPVDDGEA